MQPMLQGGCKAVNPIKVIFLDFDGVLNTVRTELPPDVPEAGSIHWVADQLEREKVVRVTRMIKETGANVVVTSSFGDHMSYRKLERALFLRGFEGYVIDRIGRAGSRADAIQAWLSDRRDSSVSKWPVESYVVIDDMDMTDSFPKNQVLTSVGHGLTDELADKAIEILRRRHVVAVEAALNAIEERRKEAMREFDEEAAAVKQSCNHSWMDGRDARARFPQGESSCGACHNMFD